MSDERRSEQPANYREWFEKVFLPIQDVRDRMQALRARRERSDTYPERALKQIGVRIDEAVALAGPMESWREEVRTWTADIAAGGAESPIAFLPARHLPLAHRYARLAAIHDVVCEGAETIDPWPGPELRTFSETEQAAINEALFEIEAHGVPMVQTLATKMSQAGAEALERAFSESIEKAKSWNDQWGRHRDLYSDLCRQVYWLEESDLRRIKRMFKEVLADLASKGLVSAPTVQRQQTSENVESATAGSLDTVLPRKRIVAKRAIALLTTLADTLGQHIEVIKKDKRFLGGGDAGERLGPEPPESVAEAAECLRELELVPAASRLESEYQRTARPLLDAFYCRLARDDPAAYGLARKHLRVPPPEPDDAKFKSCQEERRREFLRRASKLRNWMGQLRDFLGRELSTHETQNGRNPGAPSSLPFAPKRSKQRPDSGTKLKAQARRELVIGFVKEFSFDGTLEQLKTALRVKKGLEVSVSTLSRYLRGTRSSRAPERAAKGRGEHEGVHNRTPLDELIENERTVGEARLDAWTMPDDDSDGVS